MPALREFQRDFAQALLRPNAQARVQFGAELAVYQNTVAKGLVDVLRANFPTVVRLVGDEWFDAAALQYAHEYLPDQPALALYGAAFPKFLKTEQLPYLSAVASLDRFWSEAHFAADAPTLQARQLAVLSPQALSEQQLQLHPAARCMRCPHSAVTIWRANRPPAIPPEALEVADADEAVLITRPQGQVHIEPLSLAGHEFLLRLQASDTLGEAANMLLATDTSIDVAALLAMLLNAGAFSSSAVTVSYEDTLS